MFDLTIPSHPLQAPIAASVEAIIKRADATTEAAAKKYTKEKLRVSKYAKGLPQLAAKQIPRYLACWSMAAINDAGLVLCLTLTTFFIALAARGGSARRVARLRTCGSTSPRVTLALGAPTGPALEAQALPSSTTTTRATSACGCSWCRVAGFLGVSYSCSFAMPRPPLHIRYPLVVKLGTITAKGADVFSYAADEDDMVLGSMQLVVPLS